MCGIVGYVGTRNATPLLIEGLKQLEYRGYDSAGIAVINKNNQINISKRIGRVSALEEICGNLTGTVGIGHTRWATHGKPSDVNSHPHPSGKFAVVHNGIIENFLELKVRLIDKGVVFTSDTDTEVIAHLLNENYNGNLIQTLGNTVDMLQGSFAIAVICEDYPDCIAVAKKNNPLIIGRGKGENFIASDIPALAKHTNKVYILKDDDLVIVTKDAVTFYNKRFQSVSRDYSSVNISPNSLDLGSNESFMIKEINEIPNALRETISNFYSELDLEKLKELLKNIEEITIIGCGTAYHSGLAGKYAIEKLARIPVNIEIASEFRYKNPIIKKNTLIIAVSQSGETADVIAAAKLVKTKRTKLLVISNVSSAQLCQYADYVIPTIAGIEIAVAATKSYNAQLTVFFMLAMLLAELKQNLNVTDYHNDLNRIPIACEKILKNTVELEKFAEKFSNISNVFFLGRNIDYAVAVEGSLKLKEISYIFSEGYPAGELKHGTIALIDENSLVVALITQESFAEKTFNAIHEVKARGATVLAVTSFPEYAKCEGVDLSFVIPDENEFFAPILSIIPLQLFAYFITRAKGLDADKPRNLAKSVTVE